MATDTKPKKETKPTSKVGNLGSDLELEFTPTGKAICKGRLAVTRSVKQPDGEYGKETDWYDLDIWEGLGENAACSLGKGMRVVVIGRGWVDTFEGRDGEQHQKKVITVDAIGPDLRWAQATVTRNENKPGQQALDNDEEPF